MKSIIISKFQKKPAVIEAIKFDGKNGFDINKWSDGKVVESPVLEPTPDNPTGHYLQIKTLEGTMTAIVNDWIIKGIAGEFYPCKPQIFFDSYERVMELT